MSPEVTNPSAPQAWIKCTPVGPDAGFIKQFRPLPPAQQICVTGHFSEVTKGEARSARGASTTLVAIKTLHAVHNGDHGTTQSVDRMKNRLNREIELHRSLDHENIGRLLAYAVSENLYEQKIITRWYTKGTLQHLMGKSSETGLNDLQKHEIVNGIASGLDYLHSLNPPVVHGDIKSDNIVFSESLVPKIIDFGLSVRLTPGASPDDINWSDSQKGGNKAWLRACRLDVPLPTPKDDIHAFGCVVLMIKTGKPPYHDLGTNETAIVGALLAGRMPSHPEQHPETLPPLSPWWTLMMACWTPLTLNPVVEGLKMPKEAESMKDVIRMIPPPSPLVVDSPPATTAAPSCAGSDSQSTKKQVRKRHFCQCVIC